MTGNMKYVYYGFGGFIGFICGFVIQLIVFMVEKSGNRILTQLGRGDYGVIGQGLLALYQALPYLGIVLGVVMVRLIFKKEIENQASGKKKDAADPPGK